MNRKTTRADVARMARVSESTVSRAMNDSPKISEPVKERVRHAAEKLGYIPNRQAALFATQKSFRIGLVVRTYKSFSPFSRSYFPRLLDGVVLAAEEGGYSVTIILDKINEQYKDLGMLVKSKEVDGLVFSVSPHNDPRFKALREDGIPIVLTNNFQEGIPSVNCRAYNGMREAFQHAQLLGHTHIGYISGDQDYWDGYHRLEVFKTLADEFDLKTSIVNGDFSKTSGYRASSVLLEQENSPRLILCASDRGALGIMQYCKERNLSIPQDLSIIGFDNLGPARDTEPGLTTIHQPVTRMGSEAIRILIDIIENGYPEDSTKLQKYFESGLIIRGTTGIPRA